MRIAASLLIILFGLTVEVFAEEKRPRVDRYAKGFIGEEGIEVVLLGFGERDKKEFLLRFSGINHELDGKIIKVKLVELHPSGRKYKFLAPSIKLAKEDKNCEQGEGSKKSKKDRKAKCYYPIMVTDRRYKAIPPGMKASINIRYDKALSRSITPENMLTSYLEQQ